MKVSIHLSIYLGDSATHQATIPLVTYILSLNSGTSGWSLNTDLGVHSSPHKSRSDRNILHKMAPLFNIQFHFTAIFCLFAVVLHLFIALLSLFGGSLKGCVQSICSRLTSLYGHFASHCGCFASLYSSYLFYHISNCSVPPCCYFVSL